MADSGRYTGPSSETSLVLFEILSHPERKRAYCDDLGRISSEPKSELNMVDIGVALVRLGPRNIQFPYVAVGNNIVAQTGS